MTLIDIRTQETHARVNFIDVPDAIEASFEPAPPTYRITDDRIYIRFVHTVRILTPRPGSRGSSPSSSADDTGDPPDSTTQEIGQILTAHLVELSFTGEVPTDDDIDSDVISSTLFIAYPYVRADLQRLSEWVGLPSIVLPFLRPSLPEPSAAGPDAPEDFDPSH